MESEEHAKDIPADIAAVLQARFQATADGSALLVTIPVTVVIPIDALIQCIQTRTRSKLAVPGRGGNLA